MASSSNVWHYTNFNALKEILKYGYLLPSEGGGERYDFLGKGQRYFKRVCLTNLNQNNNKTHRKKFGDCCIGFKNKWANNNKLCPVIYCRRNGKLTELIKNILKQIDPKGQELLLQYCKQYSDYDPHKKDIDQRDILRRYDEQEWRYIPESDDDVLKFNKEDISKIYVPSETYKEELSKLYPKYEDIIHISKNR